jgi:hypothetical protein
MVAGTRDARGCVSHGANCRNTARKTSLAVRLRAIESAIQRTDPRHESSDANARRDTRPYTRHSAASTSAYARQVSSGAEVDQGATPGGAAVRGRPGRPRAYPRRCPAPCHARSRRESGISPVSNGMPSSFGAGEGRACPRRAAAADRRPARADVGLADRVAHSVSSDLWIGSRVALRVLASHRA